MSASDENYEVIKRLGLMRKTNFAHVGLDVLIDSELKPWLIEVNGRPEMNANASDMQYVWFTNAQADILNLVGIEKVDRDSPYGQETPAQTFEKEKKYH